MKKCARCGQEKPLEDFYRDVRFDDGRLRGTCKECMSNRRPKAIVVPTEKECSKCGQVKPASEFLADSRHADGLRAECKSCFYSNDRYEQSLEWRRTNPDKIREYNARQRKARREYQQRWRAANPEAAAAKDRLGAKHRRERHYDRMQEGWAVSIHRRRARQKSNGPNDLTAAQWRAIKATYGNACAYCGKKVKKLTMEHVIPLAKGGPHTATNVLPACWPCNREKRDEPAPTHQPHLLV